MIAGTSSRFGLGDSGAPMAALYDVTESFRRREKWLAQFRAATVAAGLPWVTPTLCDCREDIDFYWSARFEIGGDQLTYDCPGPQKVVSCADMAACVELYRRWLEKRA